MREAVLDVNVVLILITTIKQTESRLGRHDIPGTPPGGVALLAHAVNFLHVDIEGPRGLVVVRG